MSMHALIEIHQWSRKWPKTCLWCCDVEYTCAGLVYSCVSAFAHGAFIMAFSLWHQVGSLKKNQEKGNCTKWQFGLFQVNHLKHTSGTCTYKWSCLKRAHSILYAVLPLIFTCIQSMLEIEPFYAYYIDSSNCFVLGLSMHQFD